VNEDLRQRRRSLEAARATGDAGDGPPGSPVRPEVRQSWARCAVDLPITRPAAPFDPAALGERWDASLIRRAAPGLTAELAELAEAGGMVAAITDESGRILWSSGGTLMARRAERVHFTAGGRWDEPSAGTNAPALALLSGQPATVFSAEHWCEALHDWVCYAAPVRHRSGQIVGVIDLSTTWQRAHPLALSTVTTMARLVEAGLAASPAAPAGSFPTLEVRALGHPWLMVDGTPLFLPLRQLEIVCLLLVRGQATLDELHWLLYGDRPVTMATLKAEISHLRRVLGGRVASRPYRLEGRCRADFVAVVDHLRAGRLAEAVAAYGGPLLPASEAPAVVEHRHYVDVALRTALLRHGSAGDLVRFAGFHPYDRELVERAAAVVDPADPALAEVEARRHILELAG